MYVFGGYEEIIERWDDMFHMIDQLDQIDPDWSRICLEIFTDIIQVRAGCVPVGPDKPDVEASGRNCQFCVWVLFANSAPQACIGEPPVHRDFHSATAIGLKASLSWWTPSCFLGSLMFIFGGRSDLTGGQWHVNMGPDYYSNKVRLICLKILQLTVYEINGILVQYHLLHWSMVNWSS